ncbi:MAG TPA: DUF4382 domain-containing protein [Geopsychrobacteraceae bacterium]|nr:DUF4382 domain-containing protein [Geopsychrobacteraceae bacterium]
MKSNWKMIQAFLMVSALFILTACGGSSSETSTSTGGTTGNPQTELTAGMGGLSLSLTDATPYQYQAVYVTIDEISVHLADTDSWQVVATPMQTVNLLELVNGIFLHFGLTEMNPGQYTQLRLLIGNTPDGSSNIFDASHPYANYVIDQNDDAHRLKVPSGMQSGIKLVKGFNIAAGEITELILDFDAAKSVVKAGKSGKWILKPTIKVLNTRHYALIQGTVEDLDEPGLWLQGTLVSAQNTSADEDEWKQVTTAAATMTDELGQYKLIVNPDDYNLVAYTEGYDPACTKVAAVSGVSWTGDFLLTENVTAATLTGGVSLLSDDEDSHVDVSVRQELFCYDETLMVEILSDQIVNNGAYNFTLPAGNYRVVASTTGKATLAVDVELPDGEVVTQDFNFE